MTISSRPSRLWFKRSDETSLPTSPQAVTFTRFRSRSHTEGAAERARRREHEHERTASSESSKPWAKLAARLKSFSASSAPQDNKVQYIQRRSQTPSADHLTEMMRRHQLEDAESEQRNRPLLTNRVSRSASSASQRSGLRPPPRRLSTQSSRSDLTQLEPGSCVVTPITPSSSQFGTPLPPPTPPGSAHPSPTFSPPERIRRSWSGHPFASRPPGYTPESSETWSDYQDVGTLCSVPEFERTASFEPPRSPPPDHPFMCKRGIPRSRRGTFGANEVQ